MEPKVGAGVDWPPRVDAEFGKYEYVGPFANPLAEPVPPPPEPDPALLDRLSKAEADLAAAVAAGKMTAERAAELSAEVAQLRADEVAAPAPGEEPAAPDVPSMASGFLTHLMSGDVMGAVLAPDGLLSSVLLLLAGAKGRKAWKKRSAEKAARQKRIDEIEAKIKAGTPPQA